jgi:hypothetical protein
MPLTQTPPNHSKNMSEIKRQMGTVVYAYDSSYLGGRDLEDPGLKSALAKSLQDPISSNKSWARQCTLVIPAVQEA